MKNTQVTNTCTICGNKYQVKKYRAKISKCCSRTCWSIRHPPRPKSCKHCDNEFKTYHDNQIYCSKRCRGKNKTGKEAPAYKDGKSLERQRSRDVPKLRQWRKDVFKRDNYICQMCGNHTHAMQAHHIKAYATYPDLRFDIANGLTVCLACHEQIHGRKLSTPGKYPKHCVKCATPISGQSFRCRPCSISHSWIKRRQLDKA